MSDQSTIITCRVDHELKAAFQEICKAQDITVAQALRQHMRQTVYQYQQQYNARHRTRSYEHELDEHGRPLV